MLLHSRLNHTLAKRHSLNSRFHFTQQLSLRAHMRNFMLLTIRGLCLVVGYAATFVMAKVFTQEAFGLYFSLASTVTVLFIFGSFGSAKAVLKNSATQDDDIIKPGSFFHLAAKMFCLLAIPLGFAGAVIVGHKEASQALHNSPAILVSTYSGLMLFGITSLLHRYYLGRRRVIAAEFMFTLLNRLFLFLFVLVLWYTGCSSIGLRSEPLTVLVLFPFIYLVPLIIAWIFSIRGLMRGFGARAFVWRRHDLRKTLGAMLANRSLLGMGFLAAFSKSLDLFGVSVFLDLHEVGLVAILLKLVTLQLFVLTALNGAFSGTVAHLTKTNRYDELLTSFRRNQCLAFMCGLSIFILYCALGRQILGAFYPECSDGHIYLIFLSSCVLVNTLTGPVGVILEMGGEERRIVKVLVVTLILKLTLIVSLVPICGIPGFILAYGMATLSSNIWASIEVYRTFGINVYSFHRTEA